MTTQLPEAWARIRDEDGQRRMRFIFNTDDMKIQTAGRLGKDSADALINHFVYRLNHALKSGLEARGFIIDPAAITRYRVDVESLALGFKGSTSLAHMNAQSVIRIAIKRAKYQTLVSRQVSAQALGRPHISYNFMEYNRLISKCSQILVQRAFPKPVLEAIADSTNPAGFEKDARTSPPAAAVASEEADRPGTDRFPTDSGLNLGNYYALVIGNNAYHSLPPLETAINDARAVAQLLRNKYGFRVDVLIDATREDILRALNRYRRMLDANDNLLI